MFFRNLTLYRFPVGLAGFDAVEHSGKGGLWLEAPLFKGLRDAALRPVGPLELVSRGFVSPYGRDSEVLHHHCGETLWLTVGTEARQLPGAVVNEELAKRLRALEVREGRRPGGRVRKQMKDDVVAELLPRAFVKPTRTDLLVDLARGVCAVDIASRKAADAAVSELRRALGSFPALPLHSEADVRGTLTGWLAGDPLPTGIALGDECVLMDAAEGGATVRCTRQDMASDEIARHLEAGKQCMRLQLLLEDHVSCVVGEDLVVRKFKLLDGAVERLDQTEPDDLVAELDARFALMAGEFGRLFDVLDGALRFDKAGG